MGTSARHGFITPKRLDLKLSFDGPLETVIDRLKRKRVRSTWYAVLRPFFCLPNVSGNRVGFDKGGMSCLRRCQYQHALERTPLVVVNSLFTLFRQLATVPAISILPMYVLGNPSTV